MEELKNYWQGLWEDGRTRWDVGYAVPVITDYADRIKDKSLKILIPGAGNAYEAEYLYKQGFKNLFVLDIAFKPLENFNNRVKNFPQENLVNEDFFEHRGQYDLIIEYVFFIALHPSLRAKYAEQVFKLLKPGGRLVGSLLNDPLTGEEGPPYGGTKEEYLKYFEPYFEIEKYEDAYNSIKPRAGRELFINFVRKL